MSTPFAFLANATLEISVTTATMVSNPETGNLVPQREIIVVQAFLKPDNKPRGIFYPGIDETEEPMIGYAVDPEQLPNTVKTNAKAQAVISGVKGIFILNLATPSPFSPIVDAVTGTKLAGLFKRQT